MNYIDKYLKNTNHSKRLKEHILGTVKTGRELAIIFNENVLNVEIACIYHDWAKEWSVEELNQYVMKNMNYYNGYIDQASPDFLLDNKNISHGKVAAHYLKENWAKELVDIDFSQDIINGISFHTTGRKEMSKLEMIVYLADAIEPNRSYDGVNETRTLSKINLEKACFITMKNTYNQLIEKGLEKKEIHRDTLESIDYYKGRVN